MKEEMLLTLAVVVVWSGLAVAYALAPGLGMPGYVRVWGAGAVVFLGLAVVLLAARLKRR